MPTPIKTAAGRWQPPAEHHNVERVPTTQLFNMIEALLGFAHVVRVGPRSVHVTTTTADGRTTIMCTRAQWNGYLGSGRRKPSVMKEGLRG